MTARLAAPAEIARAKLNLCLHVVGQRPDGYHRLESYVVFPEIGDRIEAESARGLSLSVDGPFGLSLGSGPDNLALRAAIALRDWAATAGGRGPETLGAALHLSKILPVASGIGGGSADAAAALRALDRLWGLAAPKAELRRLALSIGADAPVCLLSRPTLMRGVGEELLAAPAPPDCAVVLVNPGQAVATPEVFAALAEKRNAPTPPLPDRFAALDALVDWLSETRNDLQGPAERICPAVREAIAALEADGACRFARMSGSGATCFGLFATRAEAARAGEAIRAVRPAWWVAAAALGGAAPCP